GTRPGARTAHRLPLLADAQPVLPRAARDAGGGPAAEHDDRECVPAGSLAGSRAARPALLREPGGSPGLPLRGAVPVSRVRAQDGGRSLSAVVGGPDRRLPVG